MDRISLLAAHSPLSLPLNYSSQSRNLIFVSNSGGYVHYAPGIKPRQNLDRRHAPDTIPRPQPHSPKKYFTPNIMEKWFMPVISLVFPMPATGWKS